MSFLLINIGTIRTRTPNAMASFTVTAPSGSPRSRPQNKGEKVFGSQDMTNQGKSIQGQWPRTAPTRPEIGNGTTQAILSAISPIPDSNTRKRTANEEPGARDPKGLLLLTFPMKLHLMLERCESERKNNVGNKRQKNCEENQYTANSSSNNKNNNDIIVGWLPSGRSFKIYDEERFVREIMPLYFLCKPQEKCSFETFKRNLDLWGFTNMSCVEGPTTRSVHVCYHLNFIRNQPSACRAMRFRVMEENG